MIFYLTEEAAQAMFNGLMPYPFSQQRAATVEPIRVVQQWIEDTCVTGPGRVAVTVELYDCFKDWLGNSGAMPPTIFTGALKALGFQPTIIHNKGGTFRAWRGLALHQRPAMARSWYYTPAALVPGWISDKELETGQGLSASATDLYASFKEWCDSQAIPAPAYRVFYRYIRGLGFTPKQTPEGLILEGIGFPTEEEEEAGNTEDRALIAFFAQWLNQMVKVPGHTVEEDKLYMCYHRYCVYYNEVPMTLIGFRAAMATTSAPPEDVPFVNADLKEYCGIKIPAEFLFRMYGEMPF